MVFLNEACRLVELLKLLFESQTYKHSLTEHYFGN